MSSNARTVLLSVLIAVDLSVCVVPFVTLNPVTGGATMADSRRATTEFEVEQVLRKLTITVCLLGRIEVMTQ